MPLSLTQISQKHGSSFFSDYEVFIAQRQFGNSRTETVKLVYTFLPYQKRLTEYVHDHRVHTFHVVRVSSCDESLMDMMLPDDSQPPAAAMGSPDYNTATRNRKNLLLPCFVTSADDFLRSIERGR